MGSIVPMSVAVTPKDQAFYRQLGQRIAARRKACRLTQQQLADTLGVSQQALAHYEVGRLRVAVSLLGPIAAALDTSAAELLEEPAAKKTTRRGPTPALQRRLEEVARLPRARQKMIHEMLEALIRQDRAS